MYKAHRAKVRIFQRHLDSFFFFFFQAEDGIRGLVRSRGLGDVYKKQSSTCGGGGTCGQCKVRLDSSVKVTSAEHVLLTKEQLQQGYRLACQHDATETKRLTLIDVTKAKKYLLELTHSEFISPYIKELRFKVLGGEKLKFKAGAHLRFYIPPAKGISIPARLPDAFKYHWRDIEYLEYEHQACSRSYSLANGDGQIEDGTIYTIHDNETHSQ